MVGGWGTSGRLRTSPRLVGKSSPRGLGALPDSESPGGRGGEEGSASRPGMAWG